MTAQPSSQAEREDVAREVLAIGERFLAACWSAWSCGEPLHRVKTMLDRADEFQAALNAFSDREHATPCSMPEEVVEASKRAGNLLPMADAPRGEYILARYRRNDDERTAHWSGRWFVIRHEGRTPSDYDLGWALFPGYGGVPDISFDGWLSLPEAGTIPGASA